MSEVFDAEKTAQTHAPTGFSHFEKCPLSRFSHESQEKITDSLHRRGTENAEIAERLLICVFLKREKLKYSCKSLLCLNDLTRFAKPGGIKSGVFKKNGPAPDQNLTC